MAMHDDERPQRKDDGERQRPSWRELDRRKDGSSYGSEPVAQGPRAGTKAAYLQQRASSQAKASAEGLFANPAKDKAIALIARAGDAASIDAAVVAYQAAYEGLPEDAEALVQILLKHPGAEVQLQALEALDGVIPTLEGVIRSTTLRSVSLHRETARDMGVRKAAKKLLKVHGDNA